MGVINAALYSVGSTVWLAGSAVFAVLAVDVLRMAVMNGYDRALADAPLREQWRTRISLYTLFLGIMVVTSVAALGIVLSSSWVEQITSALVVGIGFGLQGPILDTTWGYIRRGYKPIMDGESVIEIRPGPGVVVRGRIVHMGISSFTLRSEEDGSEFVTPWSTLRSFSVVSRSSGGTARTGDLKLT